MASKQAKEAAADAIVALMAAETRLHRLAEVEEEEPGEWSETAHSMRKLQDKLTAEYFPTTQATGWEAPHA